MKLDNLTIEELKIIALEKNKKGIATKQALEAQKIIWERAGKPYSAYHYSLNHKKHTSSNYNYLA